MLRNLAHLYHEQEPNSEIYMKGLLTVYESNKMSLKIILKIT